MSAIISPCGLYRYRLERRFGDGPASLFIMLNPSTADAEIDDPTIRRCIRFAQSFGCGRLLVGNLFAFRATKPADLMKASDPEGPDNLKHLKKMCAEAQLCIAAWGAHGKYRGQGQRIIGRLSAWDVPLHHLKMTKAGHPCHPLYLKATLTPVAYAMRLMPLKTV
jgi:hypothetical protein